ncbi:AAA family ATPase [Nanoarchaeota archaeon]
MIIGITGTYGSGKTCIINYLKHKGFKHYSMSGFITEVLEKENIPVNRDNQIMMGNKLRKEHHPGYVAEQLYEKAQKETKNCIIESIRTEGEVKTLKSKGKFVFVAIDADPEKRYQRISGRKSNKDSVSFEKFQEQEQREMHSTDPTKQNLSRCIELADHKIMNNNTPQDLNNKIEDLIKNLLT